MMQYRKYVAQGLACSKHVANIADGTNLTIFQALETGESPFPFPVSLLALPSQLPVSFTCYFTISLGCPSLSISAATFTQDTVTLGAMELESDVTDGNLGSAHRSSVTFIESFN